MQANSEPLNAPGAEARRAQALFAESERKIHVRTDQMFGRLFVFQWLAGIAAAIWISPRAWAGMSSHVHWHVLAAVFLGGFIAAVPLYLIRKQPGEVLTRHFIAVAQMLYSALLIHLTGGRIETHFHVFGSLAFLAFYRDWRVLIAGTVVVAVDHFVRGTFWPQSVFGVLSASPWRWMEHAAWVIFEDVFLIISIRFSLSEMMVIAERQASLESLNERIEQKIVERTAELTEEIAVRKKAQEDLVISQGLYHSLVEQLPINVYRKDADGRYVYVNSRFCRLKGMPANDILGKTAHDIVSKETAERNDQEHELIMRTGQSLEMEEVYPATNGTPAQYFQVVKLPVLSSDNRIIGTQGVHFDITQRKLAQAKLDEVNKQLMEASRRAGMADVATSVLHNVGNVLNSINVSSSLLAERIRESKVNNIAKVVAMMQAHEKDLGEFISTDPKGKQLPGYLAGLSAHLSKEQADMLAEVEALLKNIVHIKEIVAMQQSYARISGVVEPVPVNELVEDAIRMNLGAIDRHQIKVIRDLQPSIPVIIDKHKALQILVNVIRNAKYACDDSGRAEKLVTIRVRSTDDAVSIAVIDNGVGIPAENMTRIFNHGFTTRAEGHGFGLHSAALAAKEMGGNLTAFSDGPGQGATFTLEIPRKRTKINT